MISFTGRHFPKDLILMAVRWKLAYPLSYRNIEELMDERGANVDHSTVQKWVVHYAPQLDQSFRKRKKPVGSSWRMDETYIKVNGKWVYLYRAVDKARVALPRERFRDVPVPEIDSPTREAKGPGRPGPP